MRFELACALKYLIPRRRSLSTSVISLISIGVIALVVWLVLVFLSVTDGIERRWLDELTTLSAPLQVRPTEAYYNSYYYRIDSYAENSQYQTKSLKDKLAALPVDPYNPLSDPELPQDFPKPIERANGNYQPLAHEAYQTIQETLRPFKAEIAEFACAFGNLQLHLVRNSADENRFLTQIAYVASYDNSQKRMDRLKIPLPEPIEAPTTTGHPLLLAKAFQQAGVKIGDKGQMSYYAPSAVRIEEMHIPVYVAGFYDPGMVPIGQRIILASRSLVDELKSEFSPDDAIIGNGFQIWLPNLKETEHAKKLLISKLREKGLEPYFTVASYADYPYSKPIFEQLKSDKTLFTIIALLILLVACSNIISMLILLVNHKRREIAILQALGLSRVRIASLFGLTGVVTGFFGSLLGVGLSLLTLYNLDKLVALLSLIQGQAAFQEIFYGSKLPSTLSVPYLTFVLVATLVLSLLAGLIPAIKAAKIQPIEMLKQ